MTLTDQEQKTERDEISLWLEGRKEAGRRMDPNSADVEFTFGWAQVLDPYGVLDLTPEEDCIGRSYFACSPDSGGWVSFYDLPEQTRGELWRRINAGELFDSFEEFDFLTEA
jgi:hypothetical protein